MNRRNLLADGWKGLTVSIEKVSHKLVSNAGPPLSAVSLMYMSALTQSRLEKGGLPLWNAIFCLDCEVISNSRGDECPVCSGRSLVNLARILGGSLFAHRQQASPECENKLFDVTITVDLQQIYAKDLTATLERLTSVVAPKLARDQATFHVSVKPAADRLKLQRSFRFPERDAA